MRLCIWLALAMTLPPPAQQYDRFFDDYYFKFNPTAGTSAGFHQYDTLLEDFSKKAIAARVAALHRYQAIFEQADASKLMVKLSNERWNIFIGVVCCH